MFIGHFAVGLALKGAAPKTSLGTLLAAAMLLDLLWPIFLLLGLEEARIDPGNTAFAPLAFVRYPISHSLVAAIGWATLFASAYLARTGRPAVAWWLWVGVVSHWVFDAITHRPDLQLIPGVATRVGLGLWNSVAGTILVEGILFAAGLRIYLSATAPRDRVGRYALWTFVAFLLLMYFGTLAGPPPSARALALGSLGVWMFPFLAGWIDRHRVTRAAADLAISAS